MTRKRLPLPQTASQTAGPYVHIGLAPQTAGFDVYDTPLGDHLCPPDQTAQRVRVEGVIYDGDGDLVRDAMLEYWQADAAGTCPGPDHVPSNGARGWGRASTDFETGLWQIEAIRPAQVEAPEGVLHAPHLSLWIAARGINAGLHTRVYFDDLGDLNARDALLCALPSADRRNTLVARFLGAEDGVCHYRFDICLRGERETVFLDI